MSECGSEGLPAIDMWDYLGVCVLAVGSGQQVNGLAAGSL